MVLISSFRARHVEIVVAQTQSNPLSLEKLYQQTQNGLCYPTLRCECWVCLNRYGKASSRTGSHTADRPQRTIPLSRFTGKSPGFSRRQYPASLIMRACRLSGRAGERFSCLSKIATVAWYSIAASVRLQDKIGSR
jgi:hypothetical protein